MFIWYFWYIYDLEQIDVNEVLIDSNRFFHEDQETNNLVERFFLALKYHFLMGRTCRRVDELLLLLDEDVAGYYE